MFLYRIAPRRDRIHISVYQLLYGVYEMKKCPSLKCDGVASILVKTEVIPLRILRILE